MANENFEIKEDAKAFILDEVKKHLDEEDSSVEIEIRFEKGIAGGWDAEIMASDNY